MTRHPIPPLGRRLVAVEAEAPPRPAQALGDRAAEAVRVVRRLQGIVADHTRAAGRMRVEIRPADLRAVSSALRDHARGGKGLPVHGARDETHAHVLDRLFEELVEEPSNILFTTRTGPDSIRYDAMDAEFWIECLDLLDRSLPPD